MWESCACRDITCHSFDFIPEKHIILSVVNSQARLSFSGISWTSFLKTHLAKGHTAPFDPPVITHKQMIENHSLISSFTKSLRINCSLIFN